MYNMNSDCDNLQNSPEDIARKIFTTEYKNPKSHQLFVENSNFVATYIFEILLTILMEGFEILTDDFQNINFDEFTLDHIMNLNPWIKKYWF